jgi:two-component system sensor histidine kinase RegB
MGRPATLESGITARGLTLVLALRWWAMAGQVAVVWPGLASGWLPKAQVPAYLATVCGLAVVTVVSRIALRSARIPASDGFLFFHLSLDALALTILLSLTGGPWNPFAAFLLFHGALGALVLRGSWLVGFVGFLAVCLAFLHFDPTVPAALYLQPTPSTSLFPAQVLVLFVLVGLLAWVAHRLDTQARSLERARDDRHRVDRLRALGIVATGFSHEFATPLATLALRLERLSRNPSLSDSEDLAEAKNAATRCSHSLKTLLARQLSPEESTFETLVVSRVVERAVHQWQVGRSEVVVSDRAPGAQVHAPAVSFTQMLLDLLDNAERASCENGSIKIEVDILLVGNDSVELVIADEGPGFPALVRENLGKPFFSTFDDGAGLGLYHAVTLCDAVGGALRIEDKEPPARGSRVVALLPLAPREKPSHAR